MSKLSSVLSAAFGALFVSAALGAIAVAVSYDKLQIQAAAKSPLTYYDTVVMVRKNRMLASAVHLGNGQFLTANHVVSDWFLPGDFVIEGATKVKAEWLSPETELGMFKVEGLDALPHAELDCKTPDASVGDTLEAIGNPLGYEHVHTFGRVASEPRDFFEIDTERHLQIVNMLLAPGMSGGGVFKDGKLVGITSAMIGEMSPLGIIVPKSVICSELSKTHAAPVMPKHGPVVGG